MTHSWWRRFKNIKDPVIIKRNNHTVSRRFISRNALKVLVKLNQSGYIACLVGGSVRDLLLGEKPKDFDVATNASPEQVNDLFRNSRLIGRRFRIVHVYYHNEVIEVSTFRANSDEITRDLFPEENLSILANNNFGTIEEDAWRRDFTVNAIYYNIADFSVLDYTRGMKDLRRRLIRMIGDPSQRYHEDPVRLLRAIRFSAKLNFNIHPETEKPLRDLAHLLEHVPGSRLYHEIMKMFFTGHADVTYQKLCKYHYMQKLFPQLDANYYDQVYSDKNSLIRLAMWTTDQRFNSNLSINPGFLFAVLLWSNVQYIINDTGLEIKKEFQRLHFAIDYVIKTQIHHVSIPRRSTVMMRSIWILQYHFGKRRQSRTQRISQHRYFRAAFDFLELRAKCGEPLDELVQWWGKVRNNLDVD